MIFTEMSGKVKFDDWEEMKQRIELYGRTCYKSQAKITPLSASNFIRSLIKNGHFSVLDHEVVHVRFIADRGFTHELVRHRLCAFSQESTRYCNYNGGVEFIIPEYLMGRVTPGTYSHNTASGSIPNPADAAAFRWVYAMSACENNYLVMLENGLAPQVARGVLPIDLKTEIVTTADLTEWRHIFKLRTSKKAHPHMQLLMRQVARDMCAVLPEVFEDIVKKFD